MVSKPGRGYSGRVAACVTTVVAAAAMVACGALSASASSDDGYDDVSGLALSFQCGTTDTIHASLVLRVDAFEATPATGHVAAVDMLFHSVDDDYENPVVLSPAEGYDFFATDDYDFDVSDGMNRSLVEGDRITASVRYADGVVAATRSATVDCFGDDGATTLGDIAVTARVGVPATVRLLEHVTYPGLGADWVVKSRVSGSDASWAPGWRGAGADDELSIGSAAAALGATLHDDTLSLDATAVGDYVLTWGVVTSGDSDWAGGSGDEWGPAQLTVHVIDRPAPPAEAIIVPGARGPVVVTPDAVAGGDVTVSLGTENAGQYVDLWLRSDPVYLGLVHVGADGTVRATIPASVPSGDHRLIVADALGTLIGWDDVRVAAAAVGATRTNAVPLAATGLDEGGVPLWPAAVAIGVLIAAVVAISRRRSVRAR